MKGFQVTCLRQPAVRRRDDAHRRPGVPPAARGDRDGRPPDRAPRRRVRLQHERSAWTSRSSSSRREYDAVAITAGAMNAVVLDVPGAELEGVQYGVDFMKKANLGEELEVGQDVVVIGGGYTAMDCSRTSLRHGAHERRDRLPPHPLRARRRRGGARRDGARGRPPGVPRQPGRGARRERPRHRRASSSATASASPTPPAAVRRCRSRAPSSSSRPTRSSRPCHRRPTSRSCRSRRTSRSTAAGSRWTRPRTPRTCAACSPAATS